MASRSSSMWFIAHLILLLGLRALLAEAVPLPQVNGPVSAVSTAASGYWVGSIQRQGTVAFGNNTSYQVFRDVKAFGAKGVFQRAPSLQRLLILLQVMVSPTTQLPSIWLSRPATAAAMDVTRRL